MDWNTLLTSSSFWIGLGVALIILEIFVSGGVFIWFGFSALVISLLALLPLSFPALLGLFSLFCALFMLGGRALLSRLQGRPTEKTLNQLSKRYIGQTFSLLTPIENGNGIAKVGDSQWLVQGPDLPKGAQVTVVRTEGTILIVEESKPSS